MLLLKLLSRLPQLVEHYLSEYTFPQTMLHQALKLSANAQELGGDLLFRVRLGFSGTPSDLLPLELGTCNYAAGDDAKMLHILTSTDNVTYNPLPLDWSVDSLLDEIANAVPAFHALIDTGALVTGLTNLQVAQQLLLRGLPEVDAVIFLDSLDRKMALLRVGFKVVELAECGVALERRFTFYDQVHTTGMDIEQLLSAHAVLTLGKDMVFRDFAQGAFRLRKIGQGQHMTIFIIPEVMQLIGSHMARCRRMSVGDYGAWFAGLAPQQQWPQMLRDVVAWLLLNSMLSERTQYKLLCEQNLASVWRKRAYRNLLQDWELFAEEAKGGHANAQGLQALTPSVGVFREGVDFGVENTVPVQQDYVQKLTQRAADNHELCEGDEERAAVNHVINSVVNADFGKARVPSAAPKARAGGAPPAPPKALVIFAYAPQYEGDLALAEGDKVRVISRGEDGWWEGECKGRRGRFPASYVQLDDDDAPAEGAGDDAVMAFNVEEGQEQEQEQEQEEEQQKQQEAEQEYDAPEAPRRPRARSTRARTRPSCSGRSRRSTSRPRAASTRASTRGPTSGSSTRRRARRAARRARRRRWACASRRACSSRRTSTSRATPRSRAASRTPSCAWSGGRTAASRARTGSPRWPRWARRPRRSSPPCTCCAAAPSSRVSRWRRCGSCGARSSSRWTCPRSRRGWRRRCATRTSSAARGARRTCGSCASSCTRACCSR